MILIAALLYSFAMPNFSLLRADELRHQAEQLVAQIDLGRQRAVVTGIPHRLALDLDAGTYTLEWQSPGAQEPSVDEPPDLGAPLSLAAPREEEQSFSPIPDGMGRPARLPEDVSIAGVETPGGRMEIGETYVTFFADGTSVFTTIWLANEDGDEVALEILPLADLVRIRDEAV